MIARGAVLVPVLLGLLASACGDEPAAQAGDAETSAAPTTDELVDPALLRELLGESVRVQVGDGVRDDIQADGILVRLAFDPLIRQTGPVELQRVSGQGYRLTGIADGSPLWLLGLREGDVLTGVDKHPVIGREHELRSAYEARPSRVEISFLRGTVTHTIHLRIGSGAVWRSTADRLPLPSPSPREPRPPTSRDPVAALEFAAGLRCLEDTREGVMGRCEVERKALDALLGNPTALVRQARIIPSVRDDQVAGFKVYGVRPASIPYLIGIKNGDLVTAINGERLDSVDTALSVYQTLSGSNEWTLSLERKGVAAVLEFVIVDALTGPALSLRGASPEAPSRQVSPDLRDPFGDR
jgi:hypothetical protein